MIPRLQTLLVRLRVRWLQRASFANSYKCLYIMKGISVPLTQHKALCVTEMMTYCWPTRRSIFSYNRRLDAEHHSSIPFPMSYVLSFHPFISIVQFPDLLCIFISFCSVVRHDVHTIFFLLFPHSSFHLSSFFTSTRQINYFISILPAFAQQFFFTMSPLIDYFSFYLTVIFFS